MNTISNKDKKLIIEYVNNLEKNSVEMLYIRKLVTANPDNFSQNTNGIFLNLNKIADDLLIKLRDYVKKCIEYEKLNRSSYSKEIIENELFTLLENNMVNINVNTSKNEKTNESIDDNIFIKNLNLTLKHKEVMDLKIKRNKHIKSKKEQNNENKKTTSSLEKKIQRKKSTYNNNNNNTHELSSSHNKDTSSDHFKEKNYLKKEPFTDNESSDNESSDSENITI